MTRFIIRQGETQPALTHTVRREGAVVDLSGATVAFSLYPEGSATPVVASAAATIASAAEGRVRYAWSGEDTATAGAYMAQFEITLPGGATLATPEIGELAVTVEEAPAGVEAPLATLAALKAHLGLSDTSADSFLTSVLDRVSAAIRRFLGRDVTRAEYLRERCDGTGGTRLWLRRFPVESVSRVAIGVINALDVRCDSAGSAARMALAQVTARALRLTLIGGETPGVWEMDLSGHATISGLAAAVTALGLGWSAQASARAAGLPATELLATGCGLNALDATVHLTAPAEPVRDFILEDAQAGALFRPAGFPAGRGNIIVDCVAGYDPVPGDIVDACLSWAASVYNRAKEGAEGFASESVGGWEQKYLHDMPGAARAALELRRETLA
ncbi:MAG TPA: hypothetical protein P5137_00995 [Candidatus Brocadiia bacterium]|nr:hypothetical protein [Candidatus Brocadiia bacterium]